MYLKAYLFTCKQSIAEDFRRLVWPRDYLFENKELYSLSVSTWSIWTQSMEIHILLILGFSRI